MATRGALTVVLIGSESTGKTELAQQLAAHFGVSYVPEFVRGYAEAKGTPLDESDNEHIARGQMALEDEARARAGDLVIQDTDLLSTVVYCRHYYGRVAPWIEREAAARRPDLYLLMDVDVPWVPDGVRNRGDRREEMQALFENAVAASGAPYVRISGSREERFRRAIEAIDAAGRAHTVNSV
jgi:NadR type nicotinamide-nucleotide adenylyltransferase